MGLFCCCCSSEAVGDSNKDRAMANAALVLSAAVSWLPFMLADEPDIDPLEPSWL